MRFSSYDLIQLFPCENGSFDGNDVIIARLERRLVGVDVSVSEIIMLSDA